VTPERLAATKAKVEELAAALAGRTAPAKRMAAARAVFRRIRAEDFPNRGCRLIWRELFASEMNPASAADVTADDVRRLAGRVEEMRRLLAMFPK
jgi:hypothetical protein